MPTAEPVRANIPPETVLLTQDALDRVYGIRFHRTHFPALQRSSGFPAPITIGRRRYWRRAEVEAFISNPPVKAR